MISIKRLNKLIKNVVLSTDVFLLIIPLTLIIWKIIILQFIYFMIRLILWLMMNEHLNASRMENFPVNAFAFPEKNPFIGIDIVPT